MESGLSEQIVTRVDTEANIQISNWDEIWDPFDRETEKWSLSCKNSVTLNEELLAARVKLDISCLGNIVVRGVKFKVFFILREWARVSKSELSSRAVQFFIGFVSPITRHETWFYLLLHLHTSSAEQMKNHGKSFCLFSQSNDINLVVSLCMWTVTDCGAMSHDI